MGQEKKESKKVANKPAIPEPVKLDTVKFLTAMRSADMNERYAAWQSAGPFGADVINVLAELASSDDKGVALSATGAMEKVAHYAARPGAKLEAEKTTRELLKVASSTHPRMVRANAMHLIGLIGGNQAVGGLARLMKDKELREDARLALELIPGNLAETALKELAKAANDTKEEFGANLKQSLYNRNLSPKTAGTLATLK